MKFREIYDKIKGWIAGIFASVAGVAAAVPLPPPAKITVAAVGVGVPAIIGIVEIIRAIIRKVKGRKAQTITEVALASDRNMDANNMYSRAISKSKKHFMKNVKKSKKSKKGSKKFNFNLKKNARERLCNDISSTGEPFSVYDIIRNY